MTVRKTVFPKASLLYTGPAHYHYADSFSARLNRNTITAQEAGRAFFMSAPAWVETLYAFRNRVVRMMGLKVPDTQNREQQLAAFACLPGEQLGLFKVFDATADEVILGEDDKHLNFRISLLLDRVQQQLIMTTTVHHNNWLGRLYFLPVRPFHRFIAPAMLRQIVAALEKNKPA